MNSIAFLCVLHVVVTSSIPDLALTDSDVVIQNTNTPFVCGRNLTLTCKFKRNTSVLVWKNDNDISSIAKCIHNVCRLNPVYIGQYNISFDMARRIFNLELVKITMEDNGTKLVCSDGSHTDSLIIRVKRYAPRLFEDKKIGTIKATSGCTSGDKQVSFEWIKIYTRSNVESTINRNISYKNTSCSTDSECGHGNGIEYTSFIHAKPSENGNFYLKVAMVYGNERIESRKSVIKYMIDGRDSKNFNNFNYNRNRNSNTPTQPKRLFDVVFLALTAAVLSLGVIFSYILSKHGRDEKHKTVVVLPKSEQGKSEGTMLMKIK